MSFQSRPASRSAVKPLVGIYSESGAGKSMSALLLARGLVGPAGNIQLLDTESGRGELYSDIIPGGYQVIPFPEPFAPDRYIEAVRFAEKQNADVIVIDQMSSEWDGIGGVLELATQNEEAGKKGLSVWKGPKMAHAKMMVRLLQSVCPIIICLRAKYKSRQVKQNGKTEIVRDEMLTPIQDDAFVYEMTLHGYVTLDHCFHPTKISHPSLGECFPKGEPIAVANGEALARWCKAPSLGTATRSEAPLKQPLEIDTLKRRLWHLTVEVHRGNPRALEQHLIDEAYISDTETLAGLTLERIKSVIGKLESKPADVPIP